MPNALSYLDPAREGFLGRLVRAFATLLGLLALVGCLGIFLLAKSVPSVSYWIGVVEVESGLHQAAELRARALIEDQPGRSYNDYRLLAAALRRQGRAEDQLAVYDAAVERFPDHWRAQGNRCWYHALFGDPLAAMDSCDAATTLMDWDDGQAFAWRATARYLGGDVAGAIEDLREARRRWISGDHDTAKARVWGLRLERLEAGENPFDEATLDFERRRF